MKKSVVFKFLVLILLLNYRIRFFKYKDNEKPRLKRIKAELIWLS